MDNIAVMLCKSTGKVPYLEPSQSKHNGDRYRDRFRRLSIPATVLKGLKYIRLEREWDEGYFDEWELDDPKLWIWDPLYEEMIIGAVNPSPCEEG